MMKTRQNTPLYISCLVTSGILLSSGSISSAPLDISQQPLYLGNNVQPNIFFMIDDSGSMDWEDTLNAGTPSPSNSIQGYSGLVNPPPTANNTWGRIHRRLLCNGFNVMAYDPNATYTPWEGVDSANNAYVDQTINNARSNPYQPGSSGNNISNHLYFVWNDANNNGAYDSDNPTSWSTGSHANDECGLVGSNAGGVAVNTLTPALQINYANWWSYYRKREYVAKRALSSIVTDSTARAGLATLNGQNGNSLDGDRDHIASPVEDIDDLPKHAADHPNGPVNKTALLKSLFLINSSGGTPLRRSLEDVGQYYNGENPRDWGSSPILSDGGECQQNFAILMSDGKWNGGDPSVSNADGDNSSIYDGLSYTDAFSNTLADVAMKYYETDFSAQKNDVPTIPGVDENSSQHLVTYTIAFGVNGTLNSNPPNRTDPFTWPQPVADNETTIDDMRHAAWNGRGHFLSAKDPAALIAMLKATIKNISNRKGSSAAVAFNSTSLQTDTLIYQAQFDSTRWNGKLYAKSIDSNDVLTDVWEASTIMDAGGVRTIFTYDGTQGISFSSSNWDELTVDQQADLCAIGRDWLGTAIPAARLVGDSDGCYKNISGGIVGDTSKAKELLDYLTGDRTNEGENPGDLRKRDSRLGDIVHSGPLYIGKPGAHYPDSIESSSPYSAFIRNNVNRQGVVYVGSNDGMLHAFKSSENLAGGGTGNGTELFAYIPSFLFSAEEQKGLHFQAEQQAPNSYTHRFYVDLSPNAADVFISRGGTTKWTTVLLGGVRGGGSGIFALDVTNPLTLPARTRIMWEFTDTDLGATFSSIQVGKMNNGKWAAIFGNGYTASSGKAMLYIVDIQTGDILKKIDTGVGGDNGLSTPTIADLNGDGKVDRIYAGDLKGNMWAFNVKSDNVNHWASAYGANPMFRACSTHPCTSTNYQPITAKPSLARHSAQLGQTTTPNIMVFFGSGQYLEANDRQTTATQSFYGIWDTDFSTNSGSGSATVTAPPLTKYDLIKQTLADASLGSTELRTITNQSVDYTNTASRRFGWYIDLPENKERIIVASHALGSLVFFNTLTPAASDLCGGGSGWLMAVNQLNGGEPPKPALDLNGDGNFDTANDSIGAGNPAGIRISGIPTESRFISNKRITATSTGNILIENIQALPASSNSRMSWTNLDFD